MNRKSFIAQLAGSSAAVLLSGADLWKPSDLIKKTIIKTGESIPAVGMGSWITFDIDDSASSLPPKRSVLKEFVQFGGSVIDSSPMYGRSEKVIGQLASELGIADLLWIATKVWTSGEQQGKDQINNSASLFRKWPALLQVHNLQDWKTHLKTLRALKESGKIKYVGITHYIDEMHREMAGIIKSESLDLIQVNLSINNRAAEDYLLPLAADKQVSVIINKPFETGALFSAVAGKALPAFAAALGINTWAAYFLKYIISHPAVTCAIPATSKVEHLRQNMAACYGALPDTAMRSRMVEYFNSVAR
jgi:diketogulonate reductase-like aldo/keto reductase